MAGADSTMMEDNAAGLRWEQETAGADPKTGGGERSLRMLRSERRNGEFLVSGLSG